MQHLKYLALYFKALSVYLIEHVGVRLRECASLRVVPVNTILLLKMYRGLRGLRC